MQVSVLGPFANSPEELLGNYYGTPAGPVTTPFQAIKVGSLSHRGNKQADFCARLHHMPIGCITVTTKLPRRSAVGCSCAA